MINLRNNITAFIHYTHMVIAYSSKWENRVTLLRSKDRVTGLAVKHYTWIYNVFICIKKVSMAIYLQSCYVVTVFLLIQKMLLSCYLQLTTLTMIPVGLSIRFNHGSNNKSHFFFGHRK